MICLLGSWRGWGDRSITSAISEVFQGDHSAAAGRDSLRSFTTFPPVQAQAIFNSGGRE